MFTPTPIEFVTDCSATRAFCDLKLTLFCVSTTSGLLPDVFQWVSVHPIPIEICYGLLSDVKDTNTFSVLFWCEYETGRTHVFDIRLQ